MSEHRTFGTPAAGSPPARRHRWLIGAVAVVGAGGLAFGGLHIPVSADEINAVGDVHASADVRDGCVTAAADTGEAGGTLNPQSDSEPLQGQAAGQGTVTASVCRDDLDGTPPGEDPGDPTPGDSLPNLEDIIPNDIDDILPGDGGGSPGDPGGDLPDDIDDLMPADLGDLIPGDGPGGGGPGGGGPGGGGPGGGPGGGGPGGGGDGIVPGLLGDGLGLVPDLLDRLAQLIPPPGTGGDGVPGGDNGGVPIPNPSAGGSVSGSADVDGASAEADAGSPGSVLGADLETGAPSSAGAPISTGATLPRTGGGLGSGVVRLIAFLGLGRALLGLANRRRPAADGA